MSRVRAGLGDTRYPRSLGCSLKKPEVQFFFLALCYRGPSASERLGLLGEPRWWAERGGFLSVLSCQSGKFLGGKKPTGPLLSSVQ
jgi:hypothetical protein